MLEVSSNGHHSVSLEKQALVVIETVETEASEEAFTPTKRRRTRTEINTECDTKAASLIIDGTSCEGSPQAIASVLKAMAV